jgi:ATP-dependent Clp protease protease subunit
MRDVTKHVLIRLGAIVFLLVCMLALVNTSEGAAAPAGATHIVVHSPDGKDGAKISRVMDVENPDANFSGLTKLLDDETGFIKIWGGIGNNEATYMYNDSLLLIHRYKVKKVIITISSGGGSAFAGLGMADTIQSMRTAGIIVEGHALGYVASAAVPVLAACSKRFATKNCLFMVHEGKLHKYIAQETAKDLAAQQKMMDLIAERYREVLADNSNLPSERWREMEKATTWFTAEEAIEFGLVDEIR